MPLLMPTTLRLITMSVLDLVISAIGLEAKKDKWSDTVTEKDKWHSPAGLFDKSSTEIAKVLKAESSSYQQALSRLTFYINRAGKNLSEADKKRLNEAKVKLKALYKAEKVSKESLNSDIFRTLRW